MTKCWLCTLTPNLLFLPWWECVLSRGKPGETREPETERTQRNNEYVAVNIHSGWQEQGNDKERRELSRWLITMKRLVTLKHSEERYCWKQTWTDNNIYGILHDVAHLPLFLLKYTLSEWDVIGQCGFLDFQLAVPPLSKWDTNCHCILEHMARTEFASLAELWENKVKPWGGITGIHKPDIPIQPHFTVTATIERDIVQVMICTAHAAENVLTLTQAQSSQCCPMCTYWTIQTEHLLYSLHYTIVRSHYNYQTVVTTLCSTVSIRGSKVNTRTTFDLKRLKCVLCWIQSYV